MGRGFMRTIIIRTLAASVIAFSAFDAAPAFADAAVRVGLLSCQVDGGRGRILGSRRQLSCIFENVDGRPVERYAGEIVRVGLDIGATQYSDISWGVFALARPYTPGALQGTYAGVSGGVSLGIGFGANVLVGGIERSFALQPVSVEASRGLNLALGVGKLELISVGAFTY